MEVIVSKRELPKKMGVYDGKIEKTLIGFSFSDTLFV